MFNTTIKKINEEFKKNYKINIVNTGIIFLTVIAMLIFLIVGFIYLGKNWGNDIQIDKFDPTAKINQWAFLILLPICAISALAGVTSVVASNNKAPILLLVLSSISTLYKFSYAIVQITTKQEQINTSVLIGQPIMFCLLFVQIYFWFKWNKQNNEGKFISETFKGKRTYIAFSILGMIFFIQFIFSIYLNGFVIVNSIIINDVEYSNFDELKNEFGSYTINNFYNYINDNKESIYFIANRSNSWSFKPFYVLIDVIGSILYTSGALLMAFGNILCFPLFFLSDLSWLFWTIKDLSATNIIMQIFAITTLIEVLAYTSLSITGFIQWFNDDFEINRKKGRILIN